ncbi:hypothetical protein ACWISP_13965 [Thermolongibacillus altinsuensis]
MPIPNVKRMTDKFICLMAFSFGEVAEKLVYVGKLSLSYIDKHTHLLHFSFPIKLISTIFTLLKVLYILYY